MRRQIHKGITWTKDKLNHIGRTARRCRPVVKTGICPVCQSLAKEIKTKRDTWISCIECGASYNMTLSEWQYQKGLKYIQRRWNEIEKSPADTKHQQ